MDPIFILSVLIALISSGSAAYKLWKDKVSPTAQWDSNYPDMVVIKNDSSKTEWGLISTGLICTITLLSISQIKSKEKAKKELAQSETQLASSKKQINALSVLTNQMALQIAQQTQQKYSFELEAKRNSTKFSDIKSELISFLAETNTQQLKALTHDLDTIALKIKNKEKNLLGAHLADNDLEIVVSDETLRLFAKEETKNLLSNLSRCSITVYINKNKWTNSYIISLISFGTRPSLLLVSKKGIKALSINYNLESKKIWFTYHNVKLQNRFSNGDIISLVDLPGCQVILTPIGIDDSTFNKTTYQLQPVDMDLSFNGNNYAELRNFICVSNSLKIGYPVVFLNYITNSPTSTGDDSERANKIMKMQDYLSEKWRKERVKETNKPH